MVTWCMAEWSYKCTTCDIKIPLIPANSAVLQRHLNHHRLSGEQGDGYGLKHPNCSLSSYSKVMTKLRVGRYRAGRAWKKRHRIKIGMTRGIFGWSYEKRHRIRRGTTTGEFWSYARKLPQSTTRVFSQVSFGEKWETLLELWKYPSVSVIHIYLSQPHLRFSNETASYISFGAFTYMSNSSSRLLDDKTMRDSRRGKNVS